MKEPFYTQAMVFGSGATYRAFDTTEGIKITRTTDKGDFAEITFDHDAILGIVGEMVRTRKMHMINAMSTYEVLGITR